jgi:hypothetical protein
VKLAPHLASDSLRLLYSLLYNEHINHIQVLGSLPFLYSFCVHSLPLVCDQVQKYCCNSLWKEEYIVEYQNK